MPTRILKSGHSQGTFNCARRMMKPGPIDACGLGLDQLPLDGTTEAIIKCLHDQEGDEPER